MYVLGFGPFLASSQVLLSPLISQEFSLGLLAIPISMNVNYFVFYGCLALDPA